jgi:hypothetical protein
MDRDLGKPTTSRSTTETCARPGNVTPSHFHRHVAGLAMRQFRLHGYPARLATWPRPKRTTSTGTFLKEFYR